MRARAVPHRPARLVVESAGAPEPDERRLHLYLLADRWLDPDELETANAALAARLGSDRVGDRGRLMRLAGTRNLKSGRPGRWCRILACDLHAAGVDLRAVVGDRPLRHRRPPAPAANGRHPAAALDALAPRDWFARLEPDRPVSRFGYARCPRPGRHLDRTQFADVERWLAAALGPAGTAAA